jgi:hypothetical protein
MPALRIQLIQYRAEQVVDGEEADSKALRAAAANGFLPSSRAMPVWRAVLGRA